VVLGQIHIHLNELLLRTERYLENSELGWKVYDQTAVQKRIIQSFLEQIQSPFVDQIGPLDFSDDSAIKNVLKEITLNGVKIKNGVIVGITFHKRLEFIAKAIKKLVEELFLICKGLCKKIPKNVMDSSSIAVFPINLSEDVLRNGDYEPFKEFLLHNRFKPICDSELFLINLKNHPEKAIGKFFYSPNVRQILAAKIFLKSIHVIQVCFAIIYNFSLYFFMSLRNPFYVFLVDDFLQEAFWRELEASETKIDYVIHTGNCYAHLLFFRKNRNFVNHHMMHFSQNSIPLSFQENEPLYVFTSMKWMALDVHWVWTLDFAEYLKKECGIHSEVRIVGSILWYNKPKNIESTVKKKNIISVFDITPVEPSRYYQIGMHANYHSIETVERFLVDICDVCNELDLEIMLKTKRAVNPGFHSSGYIALLEMLSKKYGNLKFLHHSENLYAIICETSGVIAIPYTSVPYIAKEMNRKAIYYDPLSTLKAGIAIQPEIVLAKGKQSLKSRIEELFMKGVMIEI